MASWRWGFGASVLGATLWIGCQEGAEEPLAVGGPGAIVIESQEELDAWAGAQKRAFVVQGDFLLEDAYLSSMEPLRNLVGVEGDFAIRNNGALTDLKGLHNLSYVEGNFDILSNGLIVLQGLEQLERVGGNFEISCNFSLRDLDGLKALRRVDGHLFVDATTELIDIDGLSGLTHVGSSIKIRDNKALRDLRGWAASQW